MSEVVEFVESVAGVMLRSVLLPRAGMAIPQHVHPEPHASLCAQGRARLYIEGEPAGELEAGHAVEVAAGKLHLFEALEDNTRLVCIWDEERAKRMEAIWAG